MKLIKQPINSKTCGHHCIAMITGRSIEDVTKVIGHENGTHTLELYRAFCFFSFKTKQQLTRINKYTVLPGVCILKIKWAKGSHWVVYNHGEVFDPANGVYDYTLLNITLLGGRIKSYLNLQQ